MVYIHACMYSFYPKKVINTRAQGKKSTKRVEDEEEEDLTKEKTPVTPLKKKLTLQLRLQKTHVVRQDDFRFHKMYSFAFKQQFIEIY